MDICPPVAIILPIFNNESYNYGKKNIVDGEILSYSIKEYLIWAKNEKASSSDKVKLTILMEMTFDDLKSLGSEFSFADITHYAVSKFQTEINNIIEKSKEFPEKPLSLNYILLQVNEIGIDKANDIAFISHNREGFYTEKQEFLIEGL